MSIVEWPVSYAHDSVAEGVNVEAITLETTTNNLGRYMSHKAGLVILLFLARLSATCMTKAGAAMLVFDCRSFTDRRLIFSDTRRTK